MEAVLETIGEVAVFLGIVLAAFLVGRFTKMLYTRLNKNRPTSGHILASKLLVAFWVLLGIWLGLDAIFEVNPAGMFATLGIVSLALGFGLQNTVANLAAGMSLTLDKPFDVGDRVRVGQTWGDVVGIGFRSTRIVTTSGEHVVIPNSVLDTQEVWNYTHAQAEHMRLEVPVGISYDSSIRLAEDLALRVVRSTDGILAFPPPVMRVRRFAADGVELEIRCWIDHAADKAALTDRILRGVKRSYDEAGVHFPFPQRTISYLKDLGSAAPTPEHLSEHTADRPVVMLVTRGSPAPQVTVDKVMSFVAGLDVTLEVIHVRPKYQELHAQPGTDTLNQYLHAAERRSVPATGRMLVGDLTKETAKAAREAGARLLVVGLRPRNQLGKVWIQKDLQNLRRGVDLPVVALASDQPADARLVERWRQRLHPDEGETV